MSDSLSRRGFFAAFSRPFARGVEAVAPPTARGPVEEKVAVVQGRFCIALTSFCSVCTERCPVPGAMKKERGVPMVVADVCTGCGVCREVCPAPRNAVLLLPRRPSASLQSA